MRTARHPRLRRLVTLFAWTAALVAAAGSLGGFHWLLDLLSHFQPHLLIAGVVLLPAAVALRHRRAILGAALALGISGVRVSPLWSAEGVRGTSVEVLVINVNRGAGDPARVAALLASSQAAVVGLVEVDDRWMAALEPHLAAWPHRVVHRRDDNFGMALLSRSPLMGGVVVDRPELYFPAIRATTAGLGILLVHPPPPVSKEIAALRDADMARYPALREALPARAVVLGDLNATPWSAPMRRLLRNAGLREGRSMAGAGLQSTWPSSLPSWLGIPIDHVLVGGDLGVSVFEAGPENGSDHRPVRAVLTVPGGS